MSDDLPLVSVIMPAYNAARFIGEAIESLLAQTYANWELIVIDDGSTDETIARLRKYKYADSRIKLLQCAHSGYPSRVKNRGLREAAGEFIAFLDADDRYEPDAIQSRLTYLLTHPDCVAVHGFERYIDETGKPLAVQWDQVFSIDEANVLQVSPAYHHALETFFQFNYYHLPALMFRRDLLETLGLLNESLLISEDRDFYLRLHLHRLEQFHYIPKVIFAYRKYETSITNDSTRLRAVLENTPTAIETICGQLSGRDPDLRLTSRSSIALGYYRHYLFTQLNNRNFQAARLILAAAFRNPDVPRLRLGSAALHKIVESDLPWAMPLLSLLKNRFKAILPIGRLPHEWASTSP